MKTPTNYRPMTPAPQLRAHEASAPRGWLPAEAQAARALDLSYWQSRAARGFTWNGPAAMQRRRVH